MLLVLAYQNSDEELGDEMFSIFGRSFLFTQSFLPCLGLVEGTFLFGAGLFKYS